MVVTANTTVMLIHLSDLNIEGCSKLVNHCFSITYWRLRVGSHANSPTSGRCHLHLNVITQLSKNLPFSTSFLLFHLHFCLMESFCRKKFKRTSGRKSETTSSQYLICFLWKKGEKTLRTRMSGKKVT